MKKASTIKKALVYTAAGIAAALISREIPAMIRYYKMVRL